MEKSRIYFIFLAWQAKFRYRPCINSSEFQNGNFERDLLGCFPDKICPEEMFARALNTEDIQQGCSEKSYFFHCQNKL